MIVSFDHADGIGRLELRRPERHNAVDVVMKDALADALEQIERLGEQLRCLIVTGAGPSFCSGADLKVIEALDTSAARAFMLDAAWSFRRIERLPIPVLAAAKGYCLGGGFELLLHCDIVVAASDALFGFPEAGIGLITTTGSIDRLLHCIGTVRARELLLTGRKVTAAEALSMGLVTAMVSVESLDDEILERGRKLAALPRESIAAVKAVVRERIEVGAGASWIAEAEAFERLFRLRRAAKNATERE